MKTNEMCQSCGIPLKKDQNGGGTNADGTKNTLYCGYCYQNGEFTYKGDLREFQNFCKQKMVEGGHSSIIAWLFTRQIPRLQRWRGR